MVKDSNFFSPPYPYWHHTTIGKLKSILELGLLSQNEAKRLGTKGYRRTFKSSWNDDYVSLLSDKSPRRATAPGVAILIDRNIKSVAAKGKHKTEDINRPVPKEVLVKGKIPSVKILGIVIGEIGYSFKLEKPVKPRPTSIKKVVNILKEFGIQIPVYFKGKKVWPQ